MIDKVMLHLAHDYIESRLLNSRKKFEIIYSTIRDLQKKGELLKTMDDIDRDIKKLKADAFDERDLARYSISEKDLKVFLEQQEDPDEGQYRILRNINVEKLNKFSNNKEINSIWSFLNFFGREYLGLLSEQNLRLDYGHAFQRDQFFTQYHQLMRFIDEYGAILEQIDVASNHGNKAYKDKLITAQSKEYRDMIVKTGEFLFSLDKFVKDIFESESTGEKVLLDPDKVVEIRGETSCLDGLTSRKALIDMGMYVTEFISYLKIPDLKKNENK